MPNAARSASRRPWYAQLVAAVVLPLLGGVVAVGLNAAHNGQAAKLNGDVALLEDGHDTLHHLRSHVLRAEAAVRGFRLSGAEDLALLAAYDEGRVEAPILYASLRDDLGGFPELRSSIARVDRLLNERLTTLAHLRQVRGIGTDEERQAAVSGWASGERLAGALDRAERATEDLVASRRESVEAVRATQERIWLLVPICLAISLVLVVRLIRASGRRIQLLKRNMTSLVEGGELEPFPYDRGLLDELGHTVEQAAALLESRERDRIAAHREAERANEAKTAFLSRMSHELRTPLTAVLGFAELLEMDELDDGQRDSVRQIRKAGAHLLTLINEVLDISRIESGNLQVSIEPMELGPVVSDALTLIRPIAEERGIRLRRSCGDGVYIRADRQRVTQVLLNLLSNAVKYNREYGEVSVRCLVEDTLAHVTVTDTGLGIAPELLPRMFSPFDRLGAEQRGIEGTGVGLVLSKGLVEAMGGTLTVDSVPGQGSTFTVTLPAAIRPEAAAEPDEPSEAVTHTDGRDIRVLYVEDNQANIDLVSGFLRRRPGVQVITTMQGRMALDLARVHAPDLVLLDLHLPDLDGESVLRALRGHPETADVRIVILTADATSNQEVRLRAMGADDYVTKPLDFSRLARLLELAQTEARA